MPYVTSSSSHGLKFVVDPDPLPPNQNQVPHLKLALGAVLLVAIFPFVGGIAGLLLVILIGYWFYTGMIGSILSGPRKDIERVEWRRRYEFEAGVGGLIIEGKTIDARDIHRVRILVGPGDEVTVPSVAPSYDMGTVAGRARAAGFQQGVAAINTLLPLTHRVQVEAKGTPYFVAGGVTSTTAFAVKTELERALKGEF